MVTNQPTKCVNTLGSKLVIFSSINSEKMANALKEQLKIHK